MVDIYKLIEYYKLLLLIDENCPMKSRQFISQQIQREEKFSYEIYADEVAKRERIPRLTLQPLVENAIYHGLKYKENWGCIRVDVQAKEESILIKVADDGIGMKEEQLNSIKSFTQKAEKHFGLYSVNHRLLLYYGEEASLQIESKYEEGTCITIEIPRGKCFDKNYDRR